MSIRFYELDPDVLKLAKSHFGYLNASPAALEFALGDARLSLERELAQGRPQKFDVLAIDAFSSDSIPVHLITREAIRLYMQHLAPAGVLAIHISNRFLDLKPVLANIAREEGLEARLVSDHPPDPASMTDWVLIAASPDAFNAENLSVARDNRADAGLFVVDRSVQQPARRTEVEPGRGDQAAVLRVTRRVGTKVATI